MTLLTGDEYFPGGMSEFYCKKNEYLVFEDGPSVDVTLQWATYRDASDQCSLSRIWGGIHPPVDDIPGRHIGKKIGRNAFLRAEQYFSGNITGVGQTPSTPIAPATPALKVYPNPISRGKLMTVEWNRPASNVTVQLYNLQGQLVHTRVVAAANQSRLTMNTTAMASGIYLLKLTAKAWKLSQRVLILK